MASRMVMSYRSQAAQMNEEPPTESSLDLTLTQHPCDEDPEPRDHTHLEVETPRAWYYLISLNSRTLVICCKLTPFLDEPETICEGCYETKKTSMFS
jgi:hypothetical protein